MKRIKTYVFVLFVALSLVVARLFYVSLVKGKTLAQMAMSQRTENVKFKSPRGIIYDRNMIKLTTSEMEMSVTDGVPKFVDKNTSDLLSHVIGYISADGNGCGIEGAFDYVLSCDGLSDFSYIRDINNEKTSTGYSVNVDRDYGGVALTVDYHIQKIVENAMDETGIKGAVLVADCKTGEILAMASRPNFNRSRLWEYLDGTEGELINKTTVSYSPGSVFKIVVAAAALENSVNPDMIFNCKGKSNIEGMEFVCHKEKGHGIQNITDAFSNSCNCAFYEMGAMVGSGEISRVAESFGIGEEVLRINGITEDLGAVTSSATGAELANISIGQGTVMVTPLQMTDILCTICNGGVRKQLSLIKGIVDKNGVCKEVEYGETGRVITETTSRRLMEMMRACVSQGTGVGAMIDFWGSGGKTGTAETGQIKENKSINNGWFAGFFPAYNPKYVCVVIAEEGESGSNSACPVFKKIGQEIYELEK